MLLSLNSLHFQHQGAHCHVIAGYSGPKSVRRIWSAPNTPAVTNAKPDYSVQATLCQQAWNLPVC